VRRPRSVATSMLPDLARLDSVIGMALARCEEDQPRCVPSA
jgi:hypothetical protein